MSERPVGARPEADRSDWTEQDLLTRQEALPRLEEAITEATAQFECERDDRARETIALRLQAMQVARDALVRKKPH